MTKKNTIWRKVCQFCYEGDGHNRTCPLRNGTAYFGEYAVELVQGRPFKYDGRGGSVAMSEEEIAQIVVRKNEAKPADPDAYRIWEEVTPDNE